MSAHYAKGKCVDKDERNCGEKCFEGWEGGGGFGFCKILHENEWGYFC